MMRRLISVTTTLLLVFAGLQGARGAWIFLKAELAQILLHRSWERTLGGEEQARPWPWADAWPVARLSIPSGESFVVLSGASGRNLAFAPGHLDGSAPPGGLGTCVIAGHRDTHFSRLDGLQVGHVLTVQDEDGGVHEYRVADWAVVDENDTTVLAAAGRRTLVLITCYPLDAIEPGGRLRYVVRAEKVEG